MPLLHALLLGLVEGITEFLPVSSTGHLIIAGNWLGDRGEVAKAFEIFIQLGAILAVVWHYRATFVSAVTRAAHDDAARRFLASLVVAFLPAAVVGLLAHTWIKAHLFSPAVVAWSLIVGGVAILVIERWRAAVPPDARTHAERADTVDLRTALGVGVAQMLSLVPGVSRSGSTIMGGLALGLSRPVATEFSFFLAVPVMAAATVYDLWSSRGALSSADAPAFVVGTVTAFVSALVVVRLFLRYVARHSFAGFAWYRIAFGAVLLALLASGAFPGAAPAP